MSTKSHSGYPNDIPNTSFLVWERPDADDERILYLPALGRVRRIARSLLAARAPQDA